MTNRPTLRELGFVKTYVETKNLRAAAMENYNCKTPESASVLAQKIIKKPRIKTLLAQQAGEALDDMIEMREELKKAKTDYAVRYKLNADFLDRAGYGSKDHTNNIQINVYTDEQQRRIAERALRDIRTRKNEGEETSD